MPQVYGAPQANYIVAGFGVHKPQKLNELFRKYGEQGHEVYMMMMSMSFEKEVANTSYSHFEDRDLWSNMKVTGTGQAGANTNKVEVLHADMITAGGRFFPQVGMGVMYPNGDIGQIITITSPNVTVRPVTTGVNLPATANGDELVLIDNAFGEGTGMPGALFSGFDEVTNYLQIVKDLNAFTGDELTTESWIAKDNKGNQFRVIADKALLDQDYRMARKMSMALMFSRPNTNAVKMTNEFGDATDVSRTYGLWHAAADFGNTHNPTPGAFSITDDLDEIARIQSRNYIFGGTSIFFAGLRLFQDVENAAVDFTSQAHDFASIKDAYFGGDGDLALSVGFKTIKKGDHTYLLRCAHAFSDPNGLGAYDWDQKGLILPTNKLKDPKRQIYDDSIGMRYKAYNGINRRFKRNVYGGASEKGNDQFDTKKADALAQIGAHWMGANRFIVIEP